MVALSVGGRVIRRSRPNERRERWILLASVAAATTLGWLTIALEHDGSFTQGLLSASHAPGGLATVAIAALLWLAMAVGMMLPPLLPWILAFAALCRRGGEAPVLRAHLFVLGYLLVWTGFSVAAAVAQVGLSLGLGSVDAHASIGPTLAGASLLLAGSFQLTSFKCGALTHCRSPISFLLARWENGPGGAVRLGLRHGLHCFGCCWALMGLSLVLGAMNLLWMAGLTVAIGLEKLAPHGRRWSLAVGGALIAAGAWLLVSGGGLLA